MQISHRAWGVATDNSHPSRRSFLVATGGMLGGAWLAAHWPAIAAAARHADASAAAPLPEKFATLSAAEAVQVEAIAAQIIPGGTTPGAREARVVHFIDRALATFFAGMAWDFRDGLARFQQAFQPAHSGAVTFASAGAQEQTAFLQTVQYTPFFQNMRFLTVLGFLASPRYGGNAGGLGWKAIGFEDQHVFTPPFGYYDRDYPGFVPYATGKRA